MLKKDKKFRLWVKEKRLKRVKVRKTAFLKLNYPCLGLACLLCIIPVQNQSHVVQRSSPRPEIRRAPRLAAVAGARDM